MTLLDRLRGGTREPERMSLDEFGQQLAWYLQSGLGYQTPALMQTLAGTGTERPVDNFQGLTMQAYASNGIVFACMLVRQLVFSSVRFQWRQVINGKPQPTFGNASLAVLEEPWPGGTTQDLLARLLQDADLGGNSYWYPETSLARLGTKDPNRELVRMRPDWVSIVGEKRYPKTSRGELRGGQLGWIKKGYWYCEGGLGSQNEGVPFTVDEVAHFAPIPDPLASFTGMSWLTPILREIQADHSMTRHQRKFFDNGATPNMIIKHPVGADRDAVAKWNAEINANHAGTENAWKNLNLYPGVDATVVGVNLRDLNFGETREQGEVRIAAAAGTPPIIVGLSKGLDSATYSNYGQARRRFADATAHPLWQNMAGSLNRIVTAPNGNAKLWYDATDVPFLREDEADAANIAAVRAATINTYVTAGFTAESAVKAVDAGDVNLLIHSGLTSVQLLPPGAPKPAAPDPNGNGSTNSAAPLTLIRRNSDGSTSLENAAAR